MKKSTLLFTIAFMFFGCSVTHSEKSVTHSEPKEVTHSERSNTL